MKKLKILSKITAVSVCLAIMLCGFTACKKDLPQEKVRKYFTYLATGQTSKADALTSKSIWSDEYFTIDRNAARILIDDEVNLDSICEGIILRSCGNSTVKGDKAEVKAKVASYNLIEILSDYMSLMYISDNENVGTATQEEILKKMLKSAKYIEKEITINLEYIDGDWVIVPDMDLADAISGGLASYVPDESDEKSDGSKDSKKSVSGNGEKQTEKSDKASDKKDKK